MFNFIEKYQLNYNLKSIDEIASNRNLFNKYCHSITNETFLESNRLINLQRFNSDKLYPLDGGNIKDIHNLKDMIAGLVNKESKKTLINLKQIQYLSNSSDNEFFTEFTNIKDWWNHTLYYGQSKRKFEEIPEYLKFSNEKIQNIINSNDFKDIHKNCSLFEWHNGYLAEHGDGAHRMAYIITMCNDLGVNAYYDMYLTYYSINREVMKNLFEKYSIYLIFSNIDVDCYNPICSFILKNFESNRGLEAYSYESSSSDETKHILFIKKNNISKNLCHIFDEKINSQEEIIRLLTPKSINPFTA